jgi:hypothetical protein
MQVCFVIMPFRPELAFLFRIIRTTVQQAFPNVLVERGDDRVLTKPILEKIADFIRQADVIIADCSGRNPNVFYELGIVHALEKSVVLITSDEIDQGPGRHPGPRADASFQQFCTRKRAPPYRSYSAGIPSSNGRDKCSRPTPAGGRARSGGVPDPAASWSRSGYPSTD